MDRIIETLLKLSNTTLKVYIGEGEFSELSVQLNEGLDDSQIQCISPKLPNEYIELLKLSNGIFFYNSGDHHIFSFEEVIQTQELFEFEENVFPIAYFLEDYILLVVDDSVQGYSLYFGSCMCLDEFILLKYSFKEFMDKLLMNNCDNFWADYWRYKLYGSL